MSWNGKYVETDTIIDRIFRNAEYRDEFSIDKVVEWIGDVIHLIGYPDAFIQKVTDGNNSLNHSDPIQCADFRGMLPNDLHKVIGVRDYSTHQRYRLSEDSFHMAHDANDDSYLPSNFPSYKLQGNFIFTSKEEPKLEISYYALPISTNGLPLIPDEPNYILAVEWHIREQIDYQLFRRGSLQQATFQYTSQQRDWYVGKAQTAMMIPSEDEMEIIQNIRLRLRPQINDWNAFFKNTGVPEQRKIHTNQGKSGHGDIVTLAQQGDDL